MIKGVLDVMSELAESGMTMPCVTHDMGFARQVADRVLLMDRGEVVDTGASAKSLGSPETKRLSTFLRQILRGRRYKKAPTFRGFRLRLRLNG